MKGRTYRYYEGDPLYPFGFGLSYTSFEYSEMKIPGWLSAKINNNPDYKFALMTKKLL